MFTRSSVTAGPHRGFSLFAMSMISYGAGSRFIELIGGTMLSFTTGTRTFRLHLRRCLATRRTPESGDWYNSDYLIMWD